MAPLRNALLAAMTVIAAAFSGIGRSAYASASTRLCSPSMAISEAKNADGLKYVQLENAKGDTAQAYLMGACVTSYVKDGKDSLMVRPDAKMDGSKPISGGIPFCFPQFGPGAMQQHGFARNLDWELAEQVDGDEPKVIFKLTDSEYTRAMWDYAFEATYEVTLGADSLDTVFKVSNTGSEEFEFTGALHSYWSISGVKNIKIAGDFEGATYLDKTANEKLTSDKAFVEITKETDSVYEGVGGLVKLQDSGAGTELSIQSTGWEDTVVWNPYGNEPMGYDSFVCIECAKALTPITVKPKSEWVGTMTVTPGAL